MDIKTLVPEKIKKKINRRLKKDVDLTELLLGSGSSLLIKFLSMGIGYVFTYIVVKTFGNSPWGAFSLSFTVSQIFCIAGRLGSDTALIRFSSQYGLQNKKAELRDVYFKAASMVAGASLLVSIVMFFASELVADKVFNKPFLGENFRIMALGVLPMNLMLINAESLRGLKKVKDYSFFKNVSGYLFSIPLLFLFLPILTHEIIPEVSFVIGLYVSAGISFYLWFKKSGILKHERVTAMSYKEILDISTPMLLSSSLVFLLGWTATLMLGSFRPAEDVGIYNVVLKLSNLTSLALMAVNTISAPKFAENFTKEDLKGLEKVIRQSTKLIFWSSLPVLIVFFIIPGYILSTFGEEFRVGALSLILLTIGQFVSSISGSVGILLHMTGHQKIRRNIMVVSTALNILLNYLLIPPYGINGAAWASMISVMFSNLVTVYIIKRKLDILTIYLPFITTRK